MACGSAKLITRNFNVETLLPSASPSHLSLDNLRDDSIGLCLYIQRSFRSSEWTSWKDQQLDSKEIHLQFCCLARFAPLYRLLSCVTVVACFGGGAPYVSGVSFFSFVSETETERESSSSSNRQTKENSHRREGATNKHKPPRK